MVGQTLSHYRIVEKLGAGGMGEVYLAEDTTLKRQVALKVLPPDLAASQERLDRFQREAETLAALDHPNIVTIHSVEEVDGVRFLTMQLVEGKRLSELIPKSGMPLERIFEIAIPLADALAAAHDKGVIHRDLKPGNLMVTDEGRVKVLDFGLAKLRPDLEAGEATELPTEPLTDEGRVLGTVPYMSPEQLEGREIDARTDIFSLGVLLYEMATGERPFRGDSSISIITSIIRDTPLGIDTLRPDLPHHLGRIIRHCLEKEPVRRYQSALDVRNELEDLKAESASGEVRRTAAVAPRQRHANLWRGLAAAGLALGLAATVVIWQPWRGDPSPEGTPVSGDKPPMIVVLPFDNLGSPDDEYFADGMTEEVISRLASVDGLRVISRTTAMQYKGRRPSVKQIGKELGVDYVLEGSVRWEKQPDGPSRVRVTPQLIRVADDTHIWTERYDRELEAIFHVQSDIAQSTIDEVGVALLEPERQALDSQPTENLEAYQAYLRGLYYWRLPDTSAESFELAIENFSEAIQRDSEFAQAYSKLAGVHAAMIHFGHDYSAARREAGWQAAETALVLAPESPRVRTDLARFYYFADKDYDLALEQLVLAEEKLGRDPDIIALKAPIVRRQGRWKEAETLYERASELNPRDAETAVNLGATYMLLRRFEEAEAAFVRAITIQPDQAYAYYFKAWTHWGQAEIQEARRALEAMAPTQDQRALWSWYWQELYEQNYRQAIAWIENVPGEWIRTARVARPKSLLTAYAYHLDGESELARELYLAAESLLETEVESSPQDHRLHSALGIVYGALGQTSEAIREGKQATELYPVSKDPLSGFFLVEDLAFIYTLVGEQDAALEQIEELLSIPSMMSLPLLELDPRWAPLRDHPRFQVMLEKHG